MFLFSLFHLFLPLCSNLPAEVHDSHSVPGSVRDYTFKLDHTHSFLFFLSFFFYRDRKRRGEETGREREEREEIEREEIERRPTVNDNTFKLDHTLTPFLFFLFFYFFQFFLFHLFLPCSNLPAEVHDSHSVRNVGVELPGSVRDYTLKLNHPPSFFSFLFFSIETGRDRKRQEETGRDRKRQEETGRERGREGKRDSKREGKRDSKREGRRERERERERGKREKR
jgi:hypothetical protein